MLIFNLLSLSIISPQPVRKRGPNQPNHLPRHLTASLLWSLKCLLVSIPTPHNRRETKGWFERFSNDNPPPSSTSKKHVVMYQWYRLNKSHNKDASVFFQEETTGCTERRYSDGLSFCNWLLVRPCNILVHTFISDGVKWMYIQIFPANSVKNGLGYMYIIASHMSCIYL